MVHHRACNLCEAMCGLTIETDGRKVTSIRGDDDDSFSRGHICPKALALQTLHEDPDRLRQPMRRNGSSWETLSWDAALEEAAQRLHRVQAAHGKSSVGVYLGNPTVHNTGALLFAPQFIRALKTRNRYSATSVDQLPHQLVAYWMFGHQLLLPVPDVDRTQYFLMLGANPIASNGSLMTAPGIRRRLDELKRRGGRLVVVDPRRTETAERADEHLFIRPGTDALFLLGVLHEVFRAGPKLSRLAELSTGLEQARAVAERFAPERVSGVTGIAAETIRKVAREFAAAPSAVAYGRIGTSVQPLGAMCNWLINLLNAVTGNLDRPGGAMFTTPAFDPRTLPSVLTGGRGSYGRWHSRVRKLPEVGGELPVATLAEDILADAPEPERRVRAMVVIAGNPVLSTPNGAQLDRAFSSLELMISIDPFLNETSRHAHLILPPPSPLERSHYDVAFHLLSVRNTVRHAGALFEPGPDARHDWQILSTVARRLESLRGDQGLAQKLTWAVLDKLGPEGMLDLGIRLGPHGGLTGLSLRKVRAHPHGLDLGPLEPRLPGALSTPSKKLELAPRELLADVQRVEQLLAAPAEAGLKLINRRHLRDNNSWLHNVPSLVKGPARCTLMIHPDDAAERALKSGDLATVRSRVGQVSVPVEVTDQVMKGVVSLPHGYGHGRDGTRQQVAVAHAGVSVNDLSDDRRVDALSGNAALSGVPVEVNAAGR